MKEPKRFQEGKDLENIEIRLSCRIKSVKVNRFLNGPWKDFDILKKLFLRDFITLNDRDLLCTHLN